MLIHYNNQHNESKEQKKKDTEMEFQAEIKELSEKIAKLKTNIETEEATKTAFILPFLKALGYDVFDPTIVVPEFTADIGTKKGEKVDYAILKDGKPLILIEAKHHTANLDNHNSQLLRYYTVTEAKFGILTNGIEYRFYTDLEDKNKMDSKPFFTINLENLKDKHVKELQQFAKDSLNVDQILNMAGKKKYINEIQNILKTEIKDPSDDFVRIFAKKLSEKTLTQNVMEEYRSLCKAAFSDIVNELVADKINSLQAGLKAEMSDIAPAEEKEAEIETTIEELEGYFIVKSILAEECPLSDITYRDNATYFNILYKNNSWKWICRLYLNGKQKYITFPTEDKKDEKLPIAKLEDIYSLKDKLKAVLNRYVVATK